MAIDTRNKRASTLHHSQSIVPLFPNPDGSLASQADRQMIGEIYAGINTTSISFQAAWAINSNVVLQERTR
jgi:hypothetical protein